MNFIPRPEIFYSFINAEINTFLLFIINRLPLLNARSQAVIIVGIKNISNANLINFENIYL